MFYKMIENARNKWYTSPECTITSMMEYIESRGMLRDAQIGAIKTYLFLKISCESKPLADLFSDGKFNTLDLDSAEISNTVRRYLEQNTAAAALFEYSCLKNDKGEQVAKKLEEFIKKTPQDVDYKKFFRDAFYGVSYTDYLFSLPMGAGKTYLMAAFIYLDLYFAWNEPLNPAFAHNFIIFAPSGLKSSVVPSLRTIQKFDPSWVLPEPAASEIKRMVSFEVLDQSKTSKKSNKTKNPNVQKIANHQPLSELFGFVAVTNAEKVILDRVQEKNGQITLFDESDDDKDRQANELRNLIGKLPALSIFIDEVHHAVKDEIKLRAVVNKWAENDTINSVIGFSGTPYLEKVEKISASEKLSVATAEITNIVYYYPLVKGIGNFLKSPIVKISEIADSARIIEKGVREFLDHYKDTMYDGGLTAKLGIYCGNIEKLEETVYPLVSRIVTEYGIQSDAILKFHKGNKQYPQAADSQMHFDTLDTPLSKIRIVLLVQIGKEGWDCRSLTGIVLSQEGDCPKNMVLQTSCRCLRQAVKNNAETAIIYLNQDNAEKLESQLQLQHHISLQEFIKGSDNGITLQRYDRTKYLKLPKIDFYQLCVKYDTIVACEAMPETQIPLSVEYAKKDLDITKVTDFSMKISDREFDDTERGKKQATFLSWLYEIAKESFGTLQIEELLQYKELLQEVYLVITYQKEDVRYYSSKYDISAVNANIRKAFIGKCDFTSYEEVIPQQSGLLNIKNFTKEIHTEHVKDYYPEQEVVENIILDDKGKRKIDPKIVDAIEALESTGNSANMMVAALLRKQMSSHPQKDRSFHYLPYHMDSGFELTFLTEVLTLPEIEGLNLEVYYNGDNVMTEFKIKCYKKLNRKWVYIGIYTPDFLIIQRQNGQIHKAVIVETKGEIYKNDPKFNDKRIFMETEFVKQNNRIFGYERFDYLYLEDVLSEKERISITHKKITDFFAEEE
ncbi:MAG: DEAD/DEAH box helicase family protein [Lachnospiraceae bacterium]|nr:DEAD/DEAH box helicase family protein [Lachnospiraceae bacterium]